MAADDHDAAPTWHRYAALATRLTDERQRAEARSSGTIAASAQMSDHADLLGRRLEAQAAVLVERAATLRVKNLDLTPEPVIREVLDPMPALRDVALRIDDADALAREADLRRASSRSRGRAASTGPEGLTRSGPRARLPLGLRNLLTYLTAAAVTLAAQTAAFWRDADPNPLLVLLVLPLVAFGLAWTAITVSGRRHSGRRPRSSARLGLLLCLGVGPLAVLVLFLRR